MQIKDVRIDRFGACVNLSLDSLASQLNVIYGPIGSGKTAISQFTRSMLYGFDGVTRERYLPADSRGFGGSLTILDRDGYQTISRYDDGGVDGRLTIEHEDGRLIGRRHVPNAVADTAQTTFDRIFCVDHRRRPGIGALVEEAHNHGFDLLGGFVDVAQTERLESKLRELRDNLATVSRVDVSHETLCERRIELLRAIAGLETRLAEQPDEAGIRRQIERLESQLSVVRAKLQRVREELADAKQRRQKLLAQQTGTATPNDATSTTLDELHRVEEQLDRWQTVLSEVVARQQTISAQADETVGPEVDANPRHWLGAAESQVDDLQAALHSLDKAGTYRGGDVQELFAEAFSALRANLYRLCNSLSYWESSSRRRDCASELVSLSRCETELTQAIKVLALRRNELQLTIAAADGHKSATLAPWHETLCECDEHPPLRLKTATDEWSTELERQLNTINVQVAALEREQTDLLQEIDAIEDEFDDLRAGLRQVDDVDLLEQLDSRRADLRRIEQDLRDVERRRQLLAEIAEVEQQLRSLQPTNQDSAIISDASEYLRRLSAGDLRSIEVAANEQVWVTDEHGQRRAYHQLSDGGRDLVYASICLALAEAFRHQGVHLPLFVSGLFTHVDSKNVPEAAELLRDFAARGHQIILFTRHEHVANVFRLLNVPVRELDVIPALVAQVGSGSGSLGDLAGGNRDAIDRSDELWDSADYTHDLVSRMRLDDIDSDTEVDQQPLTSAEHFLSEHSAIEDAPSIDGINAKRLRAIGVMRVGDLLRASVRETADELQEAGITADTIRSWRAQARLMCKVPRLRSYDARILVACGITEAAQLYDMDPSEFRDRVQVLAASNNGQTVMMSGTEFELSRLTDWISSRRDARGGQRRDSSSRGKHIRGTRTTSERSGRRSETARERSQSSRESRTDSGVIQMNSDALNKEWRFFLQRSDKVVEAPSIGSRTAERLEVIGIQTVADLLNANAETVAVELDHRRISGKLVEQWQHQTRLACRIPQLRGHDAQILVALDITEPEELAACDAAELWSRVEPFVETKEGKRIIRNGKTPDLEEVTEWITWAQAARQLNAA